MTEDNVIPLFAAPVATNGTQKRKKSKAKKELKSSLGEKSLLPILEKIDFNAPHPSTGLKYGGFFPLGCIVFLPELFRKLRPGQLKTYLYLSFLSWRYPEKPGHVRAALPYLSEGLGICRAQVCIHLEALESYGLIECVEINHNEGNLYRIVNIALWLQSEKDKKKEQGQQSGKQTTPIQNPDGSNPKNGRLSSENQTEDYSSLSFSTLSQHAGFRKRWEESPRSAKRERVVIKSILKENPGDLDEIYAALVEIESTGKTYNGRDCYSPIGLIASSWASIKRIRATRKADAARHSPPSVDSSTRKDRDEFLKEVRSYLSLLDPSEKEQLHLDVESEIRKTRPAIRDIQRESLMFQSFLEAMIAAKLRRELPETN